MQKILPVDLHMSKKIVIFVSELQNLVCTDTFEKQCKGTAFF